MATEELAARLEAERRDRVQRVLAAAIAGDAKGQGR